MLSNQFEVEFKELESQMYNRDISYDKYLELFRILVRDCLNQNN